MALTDGAIRAATAVVLAPLRWFDGDSGCDTTRARERGWFLGAQESARCLARLTRSSISSASAFGGEWPVVRPAGNWLVAPALPLALSGSGGSGVDAEYYLRDGAVWREAAGIEDRFLTSAESGSKIGTPFDLLWFGDGERYSLQRGVLSVEDLFALLELPVNRETLDRLLIRGRRVAPEVLEGLTFDHEAGPARITVNRATALSSDELWRDPERVLTARADVERTESRGDRVEIQTVTGAAVVFLCEERVDGWNLSVESGEYTLNKMSLRSRGEVLSLSADLHPVVDPLAPGMRGRLAFDLRSDLVTLG